MKAKINYKLIQNNENALDLNYKGIFHLLDNNKYKLTYTEDKVINTLIIDAENKTVSIANRNVLFFEKGITNTVEYKTDFGIIELKSICHDVNITLQEKKMILELDYDLIQGTDKLQNKLKIEILY